MPEPSPFLIVSPEVADALAAGRPVVALESTIITHGMPFPQNLEMARNVEAVIRGRGAVPATIAIMDGAFRVGLEAADLERLAQAGGTAAKASRRDVAALLSGGGLAGTTVATTMMAAAEAGIRVFATGGIGGVHRGAESTFDISADLEELGRTPVAVVCAGAKSILDIAKTLEVLETKGVPVIGYKTAEFPAFWARTSGYPVDHRLDDAGGGRQTAEIQFSQGLGGVLIANPIPESAALDAAAIEERIAEAIAGAEREGVSRKALTPFLLKRIFELTGGKSLVANIALVEHNAAVAADIATRPGRAQDDGSRRRRRRRDDRHHRLPRRSPRPRLRPPGHDPQPSRRLGRQPGRLARRHGRAGEVRGPCRRRRPHAPRSPFPRLRRRGHPRRRREQPSGVLVTIVDPDGERSFLTDRGANLALSPADLPASLLDGARYAVCSGYSFFADAPRASVRGFLAAARERQVATMVDPASAGFLREVGVEAFLSWTAGTDLLLANREEAETLSGTADLGDQMRILGQHFARVVIKRGPDGAAMGTRDGVALTLPAPAVDRSRHHRRRRRLCRRLHRRRAQRQIAGGLPRRRHRGRQPRGSDRGRPARTLAVSRW